MKSVAYSTYCHESALPENFQAMADKAVRCYRRIRKGGLGPKWNVFKISTPPDIPRLDLRWGDVTLGNIRITLLHYPTFYTEPFPVLKQSHVFYCDPNGNPVAFNTRNYRNNPPILHRKELLLREDHPDVCLYTDLTKACEKVGLFDDSTIIGHRDRWAKLLDERGVYLRGHRLLRRTRS